MSDINITERQAGDVTILDLSGKVMGRGNRRVHLCTFPWISRSEAALRSAG